MIDRWKRAVIHLECATNSVPLGSLGDHISSLRTQLDQQQITQEQFSEELLRGSRDIRYHGTALFLSHAGRRYILTARHVVWDELSAKHDYEEAVRESMGLQENMRQYPLQYAAERARNKVFNIIFRVPSLDEVIAQRSHREFLMNLGAGRPDTAPYTFSNEDLDLALISLDQRNSRFADQLISTGFQPIPSDQFADGPDAEGQEVFTVGFPSSTALLGQVSLHPALTHWSSSHFSLPVSSFGRVSMLHEALPFFWADMSIYPGNSGGPVVANDRLVGVVSAQATLPTDGSPGIRTRIPFGRIIKTKVVRALLDEQVAKDSR